MGVVASLLRESTFTRGQSGVLSVKGRCASIMSGSARDASCRVATLASVRLIHAGLVGKD